jgi:hypothetical protein
MAAVRVKAKIRIDPANCMKFINHHATVYDRGVFCGFPASCPLGRLPRRFSSILQLQ